MRNYANKLTRVVIIASFCLLGTITGCASSQIHPKPSSPDLDAIKAADRAYVTAWLNNDPELVMATLSDDAVMIPSGLSALEGGEAIRDFWWPVGSPSATVTEFTLQQLEAGGEGEFGFVLFQCGKLPVALAKTTRVNVAHHASNLERSLIFPCAFHTPSTGGKMHGYSAGTYPRIESHRTIS
jgi:hypothetical protein